MKTLVVVGAGTAGTAIANRARRALGAEWAICVVDPEPMHLYQPGLLFLPFGALTEDQIVRDRGATLGPGIEWRHAGVDRIDGAARRLWLTDGTVLDADLLVLASGASLRPELTPGLVEAGWRERMHDFYSLAGARAVRQALGAFDGGRLVVTIAAFPVKCAVAPLEFLFLADEHLRRRGVRSRVELVLTTPREAAFVHPVAGPQLAQALARIDVRVEAAFAPAAVDGPGRRIGSADGRELAFDQLVTVPAHRGAAWVTASGLGDALGFLPTDADSLAVKGLERVFAVGDATNLPSAKAGSVAHFQSEAVTENLVRAAAGQAPGAAWEGPASCFVETGRGRALLIDFHEAQAGGRRSLATAGLGPFTPYEESRRNHWGRLAWRWAYWNAILPGHSIPMLARERWVAGGKPSEGSSRDG